MIYFLRNFKQQKSGSIQFSLGLSQSKKIWSNIWSEWVGPGCAGFEYSQYSDQRIEYSDVRIQWNIMVLKDGRQLIQPRLLNELNKLHPFISALDQCCRLRNSGCPAQLCSSSSSSIYFNSTTSISQYSNKCIQYRHNGKLNTFLDIR